MREMGSHQITGAGLFSTEWTCRSSPSTHRVSKSSVRCDSAMDQFLRTRCDEVAEKSVLISLVFFFLVTINILAASHPVILTLCSTPIGSHPKCGSHHRKMLDQQILD